MTTTVGLPYGRPLTVDDLETLPEDGHRYELLDGTLLVSPAPGWSHQEMQGALFIALRQACPQGLRVIGAPFAVLFTRDTELQPDVLVARYPDLTPKNLPVAPVLAVEIRSPSTALIDLNLKRAAYALHGVASYWICDPQRPSIVVLELRGEEYVELATITGTDELTVDTPYRLRLCPADLVRGLLPY
ncbi:Uma2 family endonuclease [soil metagenome]